MPTHRYRLHQAVVTRWGSTIKMLETFKRAKTRLTLWMASSKQIESPLNNNDWTKIENIIDVLKPLEHVRQIFSSRASNASEIIKYIMYLKVKYNSPEMNKQGIKCTSKALREQMDEYFEKYLDDDNLILSNFLNPNNRLRYLSAHDSDKFHFDCIKAKLLAAFEVISEQQQVPDTPLPMDTSASSTCPSTPSTPSTSSDRLNPQQQDPDDPGSDIELDPEDPSFFSGGDESDSNFDMSFDTDVSTSTSGISRSGSDISNISQATTLSQQSSASGTSRDSGTSHSADHSNNSISEQAEFLFPIKHLDDSVFTQLTEFTPHQRFEHELSLYLKKDVVQADPHLWWNDNKIELPRLALLANKYLSCPPSSIESERTFSLGGCTYRPKRSKLLPETGGKLIELGFNMRHFSDIWEDK